MRTSPALLALALMLTACGSRVSARTDEPVPATTTASAARPATPTRTPIPQTGQVIPEDFPLTDGYPADHETEGGPRYGLVEPNRSSPPLELAPCEAPVPLPAHTDLVRAGWHNVEDGRERQLVTFAESVDAVAYLESIVAAFAGCPEHLGTDGSSGNRHAVTETTLGEQGAAVSTHYTYDGLATTGLGTLHVVRVGSAVLLATTSNEGGAGPDPAAEAAEQVARDADALAGVVAAMRDLGDPDDAPAEPAFGPDGFGRVVLGRAYDDLAAVPGVRLGDADGPCVDFDAAAVLGVVDRERGVVSITVRADLETPEQVTPYAGPRELRRVYPDGRQEGASYVAPVPGRDGRSYRFDGDVLRLVLDGERCAA